MVEVNPIIMVISGIMFLVFLGFLFMMAYWILGKFGLWKWATYRRLKKRYKDFEFDEKHIQWGVRAIQRKWKFKDVRRFIKYEPKGSELLYTYMMLEKLSPAEIQQISEKEVNDDARPSDSELKEEVRRAFQQGEEEETSEES